MRGNSKRAGRINPVSSILDDRDAKRWVWAEQIREGWNWGDIALFPWAISLEYCPEYVREALGMEGDKG